MLNPKINALICYLIWNSDLLYKLFNNITWFKTVFDLSKQNSQGSFCAAGGCDKNDDPPHTRTLLWVVLLIGFYKLSVWAAFQLPHHTPSGPGNILYRGDGIGWWRSPHPETSAPIQTTPCHWGIWSWPFFRKTWNIPFYMCVCATEPEGPPYQRNYSLLTLKPLKHPRGANDKNAKTIIIEPWWIYQTIMCFNDRSVRRL